MNPAEKSRSGHASPPLSAVRSEWQITPEFDSKGKLLDRWWESLPRNRWVEVPGTDPKSQITPLLPRGYRDFGMIGLAGVFHAWTGAAIDRGTGRMWFMGGGHQDSSNNGMYEFALERMVWRVAMPPTLITPEEMAYSKSAWNASKQKWGGYAQGYEPPDYFWKNGEPTAIHTYRNLEWCAATKRVIRPGSAHIWQIDPLTGSYYKGQALSVTSDSSACYDDASQKMYGFYWDAYDYWSYRTYSPVSNSLSPKLSFGGGKRQTSALLPLVIDRKILCIQDSVVASALPNAWTLSLDTDAVKDFPLLNHPPRLPSGSVWKPHSFSSCGDYSPRLGKVYLLHKPEGSGTWGSFTTIDAATGECGTFTPSGKPPPAGRPNQPSPYGKFRIYERANGTFMVLFHLVDANLHIVRIA